MYLFKKVIKRLLQGKITISVAESCTGGLLCSKIVSEVGVSKIFNIGLVTYSNKSKSNLLKIPPSNLKRNGAVSYETAKQMVKNLKKLSKSKLCISITGIAGPSGGTKKKPVGLVFFAISFKNKITVFEKKFQGSRKQIQEKIVTDVFIKLEKLI